MYSDDLRDELYCGTTSAHCYSIDSADRIRNAMGVQVFQGEEQVKGN